MPIGVYIRTEQHKQNISKSLAGRKLSEELKQKISVETKLGMAKMSEQKKLEVGHKISEANKGNGKHNYWLGKCFSEEHKRKIGVAGLGHLVSEDTKEQISKAHIGKVLGPLTEERKLRLSEIMKVVTLKGKNSHSWKGGISKEPYGFEFDNTLKEKIRTRDNYTCQLCGILQTKCFHPLCAHHIDYNKKSNSEENLISLCHTCNSKVNGNRIYWQQKFTRTIIFGG